MLRADAPRAEQPWVPSGLAQLFEVVLDAAARGDQLDSAERQVFFEAGSAACDAGATLGALIDSYLRGAGQLWEQLFAETHESTRTVELSRMMREISEAALSALADGFEIAQRRSIRVEIAERRDLLDALLSPISIDEARFERAAARTGFLDASTHVVAAVGPLLPLLDGGPEHIRVQRQLSQRYPDRPWASAVVRNHLVVVAGDTEPQDLEVLARVVAGERSDPAMVGIGDQVSELNAVSESYEQAMEALRLGSIFGLGPVVHHDRLLVYRLLAADRSVTDALAEQVLEPLTARSNDALLATLAAFVESNGNRAHVARTLSVGTRTVGYRLDRIAELTGHSVGDPDGRLTLELAARSSALIEHRRSGAENAR